MPLDIHMCVHMYIHKYVTICMPRHWEKWILKIFSQGLFPRSWGRAWRPKGTGEGRSFKFKIRNVCFIHLSRQLNNSVLIKMRNIENISFENRNIHSVS